VSLDGKFLAVASADPALRVIFFHHAGGSAVSFLPLAQSLPPWSGSILLELGGRGIRDHEPYAEDFTAALADLLPAVEEVVDRPSVIFGHSLGGLLAHNIAAALPIEQQRLIRAVVVSGAYSPTEAAEAARYPAAPFLVRTEEQVIDTLRSRGGCPPAMLEDPEFVEHAVAVLGHDLHLADTYRQPETPAIGVDYHVWYGRNDPDLTRSQAELWEKSISTIAKICGFRGGHFFPLENADVIAALREIITDIKDA
jgi:surfactin synthase thioesterase subunit